MQVVETMLEAGFLATSPAAIMMIVAIYEVGLIKLIMTIVIGKLIQWHMRFIGMLFILV
jgi:hypothetical protein